MPMEKHRTITLKRIKAFKKTLEGCLYTAKAPVSLTVYSPEDNKEHNRITFAEAMKGDFKPISVGEKVGPGWSTHWFKVTMNVPAEWKDKETHLLWNTASEACIFDESGEILQGLSYDHKTDFVLSVDKKEQKDSVLYVEVACNTLFGVGDPHEYLDTESETPAGTIKQAELGLFNREAWDLYWDFEIIADMAEELPENDVRGNQARGVANAMCNACDPNDPSTFAAAREIAAEFLNQKAGEGSLKLAAIGNGHLDTAWLWPVAESRRKAYRTMSAVVHYMDEYPEYKFAWSQALYWEWAEQNHPQHFEKMKEKVKSGQLLPTGGSWIEPDCNLPSGESLVRQFLYGQRYYKQKLGFDCEIFWQPDVFGYSAQLPQIMKGVGLKYFLTQKMSWNQVNRMPHHSFYWEGLDGSQVLTSFPPADCYEAPATVKSVLYTQNNYKDKDRTDEAVYLFGHGDGGGGPTKGMLESIRRMNNLDGMPKVEMSAPIDFFHRLEKKGDDLCKWVGELYLELHRGTYTAQAAQKLYNRLSEIMMHEIEFLSTVTNNPIEKEELDRIWKVIMLNQFHDIIPGSSIQEAHEVSREEYKEILATGAELLQKVVDAFAGDKGDKVLAINTTTRPRTEVVTLPEGIKGTQTAADGSELAVITAPGLGYAVTEPAVCSKSVSVKEVDGSYVFENDQIKAVIASNGRLTSLFDKEVEREVVEADKEANNLVLFDDKPIYWDAWDIDIYHMEKRKDVDAATSIKIVEEGPIRAAIEVTYSVGKESKMTQVISLDSIERRLDFDCEVDWHETDQLLKVEFPWDVRSTEATYETQFGHLRRPTHFNTSWDMAKFEVCAHRWADLSEHGYGVAVLNDCKYGYSTKDNVMALSLLRSPKRPDKTCDMGVHNFRYAVYPHSGTVQDSGVIDQGYAFNMPMQLKATAKELSDNAWFTVDNDAIIVDTLKTAEDSKDIVLRIYESHGSRGSFNLSSTLPVKSVALCNMLETEDQPLELVDGKVNVKVEPFKIITLKVTLA